MSRHKTIVSLSITAIALLAAAVPSFAQGQSDQSTRDTQGSFATPASEQEIASNMELIATTRSRVDTTARAIEPTPVKRSAKPLTLSASSFKVLNNDTSVTSSHFVVPQLSLLDAGPSDPRAPKQFRGDDDNSSSSGRKLVTFVPSRGQKLPE